MKLFARKSTIEALGTVNDMIDAVKAGEKLGKRRTLKRLEARKAHLEQAVASQNDADRFAKKAATKAAPKAKKEKKEKTFNLRSIPAPIDEFDMKAYEDTCRFEQRIADNQQRMKTLRLAGKPEPKAEEPTKEERREMAKKANESSKARAQFLREHPEVKNAKSSAYWLKKLLEEQEAAQRKVDKMKQSMTLVDGNELMPTEMAKQLEHERFEQYMADLNKVKSFTPEDKLYEIQRRRVGNAMASNFLGNPAMAAALLFSKGMMAAGNILGKNPGELGGKNLFIGIRLRLDAMDDIDGQIDDLTKERELSTGSEDFARMTEKIRELRKMREELNSERKTLVSAVKELKKGASSAEKALIDANHQLYAKNRKEARENAEGRAVLMCDKPQLKGYKFMHFQTNAFLAQFRTLINNINAKADICVKEDVSVDENGERTVGDALVKAIEDLKEEFDKAMKSLDRALNAGKKIKLKASDARIHNGRQSYLSDLISVPYGKTTDMLMTFTHSIAHIFNGCVAEYIAETQKEADDMLCKFMSKIISIGNVNGYDIELLPDKDGVKQHVEARFWNANNTMLKVGKGMLLSEDAYEKAHLVARAGMTEEEFEQVKCNGSDLLKWCSYASTPGCPLMYNGEPVTVNDVLVVDSIDTLRKFKNVLEYMADGTVVRHEVAPVERTAYDGEIFFLVPIPSQQIRGGFCFKGFGLNCAYSDKVNMIHEIAKREGWEVPEYVRDVDGELRRLADYKIICTKDAWKWQWTREDGTKKGTKMTFEEYRTRMNKLAEKFPNANQLYTARIADATEESKRQMTRQSVQQFFNATQENLEKMFAKSIRKVKKLSTHAGVIRMMAGLDKPESARTAFEHLVEACPEILDNKYMRRAVEDMFNRRVAEAAVRPEINGIYPYIAEDPVAFFKIVIWGKDPNTVGLGYLTSKQVNCPSMAEGTPVYIVRYPNNYICGMVRVNHNDDIYSCCGNVMIIPLDGALLIRADGDTDGDECLVCTDKEVVDMMADVLRYVNPPIIKFPHEKLEKVVITGRAARQIAMAEAIVIANKYGPEVGKNSNLATKFMNKVALAYLDAMQASDAKSRSTAKWKMNQHLENAIVAHIAAIIAIDLAKTGSMPAWLEQKLDSIRGYAGKLMPWNQRFCKDNKVTPWFDNEYWDDKTMPRSNSVVDRGAQYVIEQTDAMNYKAPTDEDGVGFDITSLFGRTEGLDRRGSKGKLTNRQLRALDARNYREKSDSVDGDNEFQLVNDLKNPDLNVKVSCAELFRFLWRNQASLVYSVRSESTDKMDNVQMQNAYYDFVHDLMVDFGSFCGNERFMSRSVELRRKSNICKLLTLAFEDNECIGKDCNEEEQFTRRASFAMFAVKVFAYDLYQMVCEQKGIESVWVKPENSDSTDEINPECGGSEYYNIGFCLNDFEDDEVA